MNNRPGAPSEGQRLALVGSRESGGRIDSPGSEGNGHSHRGFRLRFFTDNSSNLADHTRSRLSPLATRIMAATLRSTSSSVVAQLDTLIRIAACPCHRVPPHQHVPSF
jgi:hypothetical protein